MVLICLFLCRSVSLSLFFFPSSSSAYAPILISISSIVLRLISSSLFPSRLHPLPASQSRRVPPALALPLLFLFRSLNLASPLLLLRAILLCSRCSARRKYSLFAPPLDMAKEAICALLAILGHFFEAFSPLDLFFALASFHLASSAFPCFPPSRLSSLSASAHPVSSSIPTYSISRPSAQVNIIPAWFPSLSETSARAVFIFRASVA